MTYQRKQGEQNTNLLGMPVPANKPNKIQPFSTDTNLDHLLRQCVSSIRRCEQQENGKVCIPGKCSHEQQRQEPIARRRGASCCRGGFETGTPDPCLQPCNPWGKGHFVDDPPSGRRGLPWSPIVLRSILNFNRSGEEQGGGAHGEH